VPQAGAKSPGQPHSSIQWSGRFNT
jgi:hypothetical protein